MTTLPCLCPVSTLQDLLEQGVPCLLLWVLKSVESPSELQAPVNHIPISILNQEKGVLHRSSLHRRL